MKRRHSEVNTRTAHARLFFNLVLVVIRGNRIIVEATSVAQRPWRRAIECGKR
jgi:hypothetical protein